MIEWIEWVLFDLYYNDKNFIEKVICVLLLFEMLEEVGCFLVFKGLCIVIYNYFYENSLKLIWGELCLSFLVF